MTLTDRQTERYNRHLVMDTVGASGQESIRRGKVLVIGTGGLGSAAAYYLAAAGIGTLGLIDGDRVDLSNLQRQILHHTTDLDKSKVVSAQEKIQDLNPDVNLITYDELITPENILTIIDKYDFVIDCTDNFPAKYLINDACVLNRQAFSHATALRFEGRAMTYTPDHACYRCIFESPPPKEIAPSPADVGVFGSVPGMIGTIQATEALKYVMGIGDLLTNRMLITDLLTMKMKETTIYPNADCPICSNNNSITELLWEEQP